MLVTVDPGVEYFAWARWASPRLGGALSACGWASMPTLDSPWPDWFMPGKLEVLCEGQAHYKGLSNAKAVLGLARMTGAVVSRAAEGHGEIVLPHVWKKQASRNAMHDLVLAQMSPEEHSIYSSACSASQWKLGQKRDVTAAIGIGLWHFGRLRLSAGVKVGK